MSSPTFLLKTDTRKFVGVSPALNRHEFGRFVVKACQSIGMTRSFLHQLGILTPYSLRIALPGIAKHTAEDMGPASPALFQDPGTLARADLEFLAENGLDPSGTAAHRGLSNAVRSVLPPRRRRPTLGAELKILAGQSLAGP